MNLVKKFQIKAKAAKLNLNRIRYIIFYYLSYIKKYSIDLNVKISINLLYIF
jgi:hypothetical protein